MRYCSPRIRLQNAKVLSIGGAGVYGAIDLALVYPASTVRSMEVEKLVYIDTENHPLVSIPDINMGFPSDIEPSSLDFVRATKLGGRVQNWGKFLQQVYTALKPGGYIELRDSSKQFSLNPKSIWYEAGLIFY